MPNVYCCRTLLRLLPVCHALRYAYRRCLPRTRTHILHAVSAASGSFCLPFILPAHAACLGSRTARALTREQFFLFCRSCCLLHTGSFLLPVILGFLVLPAMLLLPLLRTSAAFLLVLRTVFPHAGVLLYARVHHVTFHCLHLYACLPAGSGLRNTTTPPGHTRTTTCAHTAHTHHAVLPAGSLHACMFLYFLPACSPASFLPPACSLIFRSVSASTTRLRFVHAPPRYLPPTDFCVGLPTRRSHRYIHYLHTTATPHLLSACRLHCTTAAYHRLPRLSCYRLLLPPLPQDTAWMQYLCRVLFLVYTTCHYYLDFTHAVRCCCTFRFLSAVLP